LEFLGVPSLSVASPFLAAISLCWLAASSLWVYPHSLSYFNEAAGGPLRGAEHLLGSNSDWGQDEFYRDKMLDRRQVDMFRQSKALRVTAKRGEVALTEGCAAAHRQLVRNNESTSEVPSEAWDKLCISVNLVMDEGWLYATTFHAPPELAVVKNRMRALRHTQPIDFIGYSFRIYSLNAHGSDCTPFKMQH
jgi:hypothetical protein